MTGTAMAGWVTAGSSAAAADHGPAVTAGTIVDQTRGGGDQGPAQGGDHRLAAADTVPFHQLAAADEPGELVQPGGDRHGGQRRPHPAGIDRLLARRQVAQRGTVLAVAEDVLDAGAMPVPVLARHGPGRGGDITVGEDEAVGVDGRLGPAPGSAGPLFGVRVRRRRDRGSADTCSGSRRTRRTSSTVPPGQPPAGTARRRPARSAYRWRPARRRRRSRPGPSTWPLIRMAPLANSMPAATAALGTFSPTKYPASGRSAVIRPAAAAPSRIASGRAISAGPNRKRPRCSWGHDAGQPAARRPSGSPSLSKRSRAGTQPAAPGRCTPPRTCPPYTSTTVASIPVVTGPSASSAAQLGAAARHLPRSPAPARPRRTSQCRDVDLLASTQPRGAK